MKKKKGKRVTRGKRVAKKRNYKGVKLLLGLICVTIIINLWGYGLTSFSAVKDFSEFVVDVSEAGAGQMQKMQNTIRAQSSQQKASETDGGGYRPIGMGCPNGKQQRPDGWCPPLQGPEHGRRETVGSWPGAYIPKGSIIPVDGHGNIRQLRAGDEGAYPEGSINNDRNRGIQ